MDFSERKCLNCSLKMFFQSYSHAIQTQEEEASNPFGATALCFEVAGVLVELRKLSEAATFYQVSLNTN